MVNLQGTHLIASCSGNFLAVLVCYRVDWCICVYVVCTHSHTKCNQLVHLKAKTFAFVSGLNWNWKISHEVSIISLWLHRCSVKVQTVSFNFRIFAFINNKPCWNYSPLSKCNGTAGRSAVSWPGVRHYSFGACTKES